MNTRVDFKGIVLKLGAVSVTVPMYWISGNIKLNILGSLLRGGVLTLILFLGNIRIA